MKVLVTGHKGYIGTILVPLLLAKDYEVIGFDSDLYERCTFGEGFTEIPEILKDVRDADISDFNGVDVVLHLAGLSNDPLGDLNPNLTAEKELLKQHGLTVEEVLDKFRLFQAGAGQSEQAKEAHYG